MTKWPSAKHFASWLGLSPNNRITGGRVISSKTKACANRAAAALRLAANALHRSDSALGAFLRRKKAHLGAPKAITATAHKLACVIYSMLRYGQEYVDAGAKYYESQYQQRALRAAKRRAAQLGYQLVMVSNRITSQPGGGRGLKNLVSREIRAAVRIREAHPVILVATGIQSPCCV